MLFNLGIIGKMFPAVPCKKNILSRELVHLAKEIPEISKQNVKSTNCMPLTGYKVWEENELKKELYDFQGEFRGHTEDPEYLLGKTKY